MRNQCAVGVEVHQQQLTIAATRTADRSSTLNRRLILCTMIAHPPQSHMQHAASRHTFKFFFPFSARMRTTSCPHPSILHAKDGTRGAHAPSRKRAEGWSLLFGRQAAGNGKQKPMTQRAPNMRAGACKEKKKTQTNSIPHRNAFSCQCCWKKAHTPPRPIPDPAIHKYSHRRRGQKRGTDAIETDRKAYTISSPPPYTCIRA